MMQVWRTWKITQACQYDLTILGSICIAGKVKGIFIALIRPDNRVCQRSLASIEYKTVGLTVKHDTVHSRLHLANGVSLGTNEMPNCEGFPTGWLKLPSTNDTKQRENTPMCVAL